MSSATPVILLVEDNEDDVFILRRVFRSAKIQNPLQVVMDGQRAMDYLAGKGEFSDRARHPVPSLVLLDLKLPYHDGLEILKWHKTEKDLPKTTIVVLTSSEEPRDVTAARELGARLYLVKPPTVAKLKELTTLDGLDWLTFDESKK